MDSRTSLEVNSPRKMACRVVRLEERAWFSYRKNEVKEQKLDCRNLQHHHEYNLTFLISSSQCDAGLVSPSCCDKTFDPKVTWREKGLFHLTLLDHSPLLREAKARILEKQSLLARSLACLLTASHYSNSFICLKTTWIGMVSSKVR